jgi:ribonucleoside-diphosphate reductase alpha chain
MGQFTILGHRRFFTQPKSKAFDQLNWVKSDASVVAEKYFSGTLGTKGREASLKQLINRVTDTIIRYGLQEGYFETKEESEDFREELKYVLATQRASFNSPVWNNIGVADRSQQASACFILAVEDTMPSILNWYKEEGLIFKGGLGSGINLSSLRSSKETIGKNAGFASGPVSFMRGADSTAGAINSGGNTRRPAKMIILNSNHPDIEQFIWCKAIEERKAKVLEESGYDMKSEGKDSFSVQYQNANNIVRVDDAFMRAVLDDADYELKEVRTGRVVKTEKARALFRQINQAAWESGDPGLQFDTTANRWNTTPNAGRINGSNPCGEYMHLDNSACNLSSINLLKYLKNDNTFDVEAFKHTVELMITAQEILVGYSSFPTESITKNARAFRQLGLGYANLGALLMAQGLPYDSDEGRAQASAITALLTGHAYSTSAKIANRVGPFAGFHKDREGLLNVIKMHREAVSNIDAGLVSEELLSTAAGSWDEAVEMTDMYGVRNAQTSLLAPTGTISFMMDCETTGIEPNIGLTNDKKQSSDGTTNSVYESIPKGLKALGYTKSQIDKLVEFIEVEKTIIGAPNLKEEHQSVFACSIGDNVIDHTGHLKMMAAVQPFLSGSISKTISLPEETTVEEIEQLNIEAWRSGLKAVSIYRENCKATLSSSKDKVLDSEDQSSHQTEKETIIVRGTIRKPLPHIRHARTFSYKVSDSHGYITVGEYDDGSPGEIFLRIAKQGSTLAGVMDALAISVSHGLQFGVPLKDYVKSFTNMSFTPAGITDDTEIRTASSIVDYIFRRLALTYLSFDDLLELGLKSIEDMLEMENQTSLLGNDESIITEAASVVSKSDVNVLKEDVVKEKVVFRKKMNDDTAPLCYNCGNQTHRAGSCYVCSSCGSTTGCS